MKVLQGILCAAAVLAMTTGAYADGRNVNDGPKVVRSYEAVDDGAPTGRETPVAANPLGGGTAVYSNLNATRYRGLPDPGEWFYDDIVLSSESDLAIFRQLASFSFGWFVVGTDPVGVSMDLRRDLNGDATGGPVGGPDGIYANSSCFFPAATESVVAPPAITFGSALDATTLTTCLPPIDQGAALDEGLWLGFLFADTSNDPGPSIAGDVTLVPTVGSSTDVFATSNDLENFVFTFFGGSPFTANFSAVVSAQVVPAVPTVSEWGLIAIVLLVLTGGTIVLRRARPRTVSA